MYKRYLLEISVCVGAAAGMALEILGFGIMAPHFGLSLTVSSNILGIILLSLSAGYIIGGIIADKNAHIKKLGIIAITAGAYAGIIFPFKEFITESLLYFLPGSWSSSLVASLILFGPTSIALGMILPYAAKLASTEHAPRPGASTGKLYGLSSLGSIAGTFLGGFILIPFTSLTVSLLVISLLLIVLGITISGYTLRSRLTLLIPLLTLVALGTSRLEFPITYGKNNRFIADGSALIDRQELTKIADVNSQYNRIQIYQGTDETTGKPIRLMRVNRELHSGTFLDSNDFVFNYTKFNELGGHYNPTAKTALLLGGGGYSYSKFFLGDTPLHDVSKIWSLDHHLYSNRNTVSIPILATTDPVKEKEEAVLVYKDPTPPTGIQQEGLYNSISAHNQVPGISVTTDKVVLDKTFMQCDGGYVHVHEVSKNGTPGAVISPDIPFTLKKPGNIIGHSALISGTYDHVTIPLNRPLKDGEAVYVMLHRDNCNGHFDNLLVDGYEDIEHLDVVEIDPATTKLAEQYFNLDTRDPRLAIYHEDARTFINTTPNKYDIIYFDAFRSFYSLPYQLATKEAVQKLYDMLNPGGVLVLNTPSALGGPMGKFFQAEYKTYQSVFPALRVYAVTSPTNQTIPQNIVTIAFKSKDSIRTSPNDDPAINERLTHLWKEHLDPDIPILTDDFAPVDYYINALRDINVD